MNERTDDSTCEPHIVQALVKEKLELREPGKYGTPNQEREEDLEKVYKEMSLAVSDVT